ncbi:MAG: hypothetical protein ABI947_12515 [Chloroflexota bacterium]
MSNREQQYTKLTDDGELLEIGDAPAAQLSAVYCTQCGSPNSAYNRFCKRCGQSLADDMLDLEDHDYALPQRKRKHTLAHQEPVQPSTLSVLANVVIEIFTLMAMVLICAAGSRYSGSPSAIVPEVLFAWILVEWIRHRKPR